VDDFNAQDRQTNAKLPDIVLNESSMEGTKVIQSVDITTPGKVFGNMWRNSETIDLTRGGSGMVGHLDGLVSGRNAILAQLDGSNNKMKHIEQR